MALTNNDQQNLAPLLSATDSASTSSNPTTSLLRARPPVIMYGATNATQRPLLPHAQSTIGTRDTATVTSPPLLVRATTTNAILRPAVQRSTRQPATRPSLFRRISSHIDTALELSTGASYTYRNRPAQPSHWTDHAHRESLLRTWDSIHEAAASSKSKYPRSVIGQLVAAEKSVVLQFPELAQGEVVLARDWMEYVLGVSLRHPFCAEGKMGRWEVLSGAARVGGVRGWGHW